MLEAKTTEEKLKLTRKEPQELLIYFFIGRQPEIQVEREQVVAILAYDLETALMKAKIEAKDLAIIYHGQHLPVRDLINLIFLGDTTISPPAEKVITPEIPKQKLSLEQFKAGLILVLNEYTKEGDREKLKEIIKKI